MKICIIIQSEAFRSSAGMRIRYDRFRDSLGTNEVTIEALTCAEVSAAKVLEHDVYVFCKTFDATALLLARRLRASGKVVGQDLFDDYFSQHADSRLQRYRNWLREMASVTDFAICSTSRMVEVARPYMPDVRIVAVEDPIDSFDPSAVAQLAEQKAEKARVSRSLDVVWFGIGDNPFFSVGLTDLAACEPQLALMERLGWTVRLRIVTNRRPYEGARAEVLRRLSVAFEVVEWTEEVEREELARATVAIIPVNGQSFSRAKSLNRAVTALSAGCQVLSVGYPLYERLRDFIYRSTEDLVRDLDSGQTRFSSTTIGNLTAHLAGLADASNAVSTFVAEARGAVSKISARPSPGPVCVLHGRASAIGLHKAAGALGGFSVKTIFCNAAWNFPVRFDREDGEIVMRVTAQIAEKFHLPLRNGEVKRFGIFDVVDVDTMSMGVKPRRTRLSTQSNSIVDLAVYEDVMRFARECCTEAFPGADVLISETSIFSRLPVARPSGQAKRRKSISRPTEATISAAPARRRQLGWPPFGKIAKLIGDAKAPSFQTAQRLLASSSFFDAGWYLARYPDVAASGVDPVRHYLEFGWREGRNPSPLFSTRGYLKANKDVAEQGINPLFHYLEHGQVEGRTAPSARKDAPSP